MKSASIYRIAIAAAFGFVLLDIIGLIRAVPILSFLGYFLAFFNSLLYATFIISAVAILLLALVRVSERLAFYTGVVVYSTFLVIDFSLRWYLQETGLLLGADLFGYSARDIFGTVGASASNPLIPTFLMLLCLGFVYLIWKWSSSWATQILKRSMIVMIFLMIISAVIVRSIRIDRSNITDELSQYITSPSSYFWEKTFAYFIDQQHGDQEASDYPFLHAGLMSNPMSEWLTAGSNPPSIVIIAVEGLGAEFVGEGARFAGFTPFLDSLARESLYWPNCLSSTGRTFGVLPTILGSLPYEGAGFMARGVDMPDHLTLFSWLGMQGYHTSFFYGGNANFDGQDVFLERQGTHYLLDEAKFPARYSKMKGNSEGFSWGYGDRELFDFSLEKIKGFDASPRISFYLTLTTHEPFIVPEGSYNTLATTTFQKNKQQYDLETQTAIRENIEVFSCLLYTDAAIRDFFLAYSKMDDFQNTIFVITGDHRLIPVPSKDRFSRFRVPLLIYSPLLKRAFKSSQIVAHAQIAPTFFTYLNQTYQVTGPDQVSFIADPLPTELDFGSKLDIALMRNKNEIEEYIDGTTLYSNDQLYEIGQSMELREIAHPEKFETLKGELELFKAKSAKSIDQNQLLQAGEKWTIATTGFILSEVEMEVISRLKIDTMVPDLLYHKAREMALGQEIVASQAIIKYGLNKSPNFHDLRVLLARTYAWRTKYDSAYLCLDETLKRIGHYEDAYVAYADVAYWDEQLELSQTMVDTGIREYPASLPLKSRQARLYLTQGKIKEAKQLIKAILDDDPDEELARTLLDKLENQP